MNGATTEPLVNTIRPPKMVIRFGTGFFYNRFSEGQTLTANRYNGVNVLQTFVLDKMGVPFWVTVLTFIILILLYTYEGGVKTIVYTDTLQTTLMVLGLIVCVVYILNQLHFSIPDAINGMEARGLTKVFNTDVNSGGFFVKQILGGMFITIAMTGLDQEMMQKNISVKTLKDSQKNILVFIAKFSVVYKNSL